MYRIDYPPEKYDEYGDEAEVEHDKYLHELLSDKERRHDLVLDRSFWAKEDREKYKRLAEGKDGRWVLVYLKANKSVL